MFRRATPARWPRLAVLLAVLGIALPVMATTARADVPLPNCDVDCSPDPTGGDTGGGSTTGEGGVALGGSNVVLASPERGFLQWPGVAGANDVAASNDGSVWVITGSSTNRIEGGAFGGPSSFPTGGMRLAVDPTGHPWMVGFDNRIWRGNADGSVTQMPGLARDIGIGGPIGSAGSIWVIGTNPRNDSWQVYAWTGSGWVPDPGSGQSIDVDSAGEPVVNGADYKIWIKNGGANQGWSLLSGRATDMSEGHGSPSGFPGSANLWIIGHDSRSAPGNFGVWERTGVDMWTLVNQTFGGTRIAVNTEGTAWVVRSDGTLWDG